MFAKEIYIARRKALLEKMAQTAPQGKRGIALFVGNVEAAAQYKDNAYKFRQDSSWLYYFGLDEPRYAAILDLDSGEETIFADDVDARHHGPFLRHDELPPHLAAHQR